MKTKLLFLTILFSSIMMYAQTSNVVIFNQDGLPFYVIVNGIQQNSNYETNIVITDLLPGAYKVKIIFKNNQLPPIDKNIYLEANNQYTFQIKQTKKGAYVLRPFSITPLAQTPAPPATQHVIVYHNTPIPTQATTVTTTQTTIQQTNTTPGHQVSMSVNMPSANVNINTGTNIQATSTYSETTTVTTTYGTGSYYDANGVEHPDPKPNAYYNMPGYNGQVGCPYPMTPQDFSQAKNSISAKSFEDSKLTLAKQIVRSNCLTAQQVKELMLLFDFEDTKLELAKFAYDYTFDLGNYYKVNDAFDFESSIDELNAYINRR